MVPLLFGISQHCDANVLICYIHSLGVNLFQKGAFGSEL